MVNILPGATNSATLASASNPSATTPPSSLLLHGHIMHHIINLIWIILRGCLTRCLLLLHAQSGWTNSLPPCGIPSSYPRWLGHIGYHIMYYQLLLSEPPIWNDLRSCKCISLYHISMVKHWSWWDPLLDPKLPQYPMGVVWLHHFSPSLEEALLVNPHQLLGVILPNKVCIRDPH